MSVVGLLFAAAASLADTPPVPGLCTAPVPANRDATGCYQTSQIDLEGAPPTLFWHVYEYAQRSDAEAEARRHQWAAVADAHSRVWLYVLAGPAEAVSGGVRRAVIGPLAVPSAPATAHFSEAVFPPGMRTRVHAHPGPEAFYIVEGEQCMETPTDKRKIAAGGSYIVPGGLHIQTAPHGRRNLVVILAPKDRPFVIPGGAWTPSGFCDS